MGHWKPQGFDWSSKINRHIEPVPKIRGFNFPNPEKKYSGCNLRTSFSEVALDAEECRWSGGDNMVEIRKNRREASMRKKLRKGLQNAFVVQSYTSFVEKKASKSTSNSFWCLTDDDG